MDMCHGDNKQFDSYEECISFNKNIPVFDEKCFKSGASGMGGSKACRVIHQHMMWTNPAHCFHTGIGGEDPEGGAHCFPGECDDEHSMDGMFSEGSTQWKAYFESLGTHECIDGLWEESVYLYKWSKPTMAAFIENRGDISGVDFDCLILGQ